MDRTQVRERKTKRAKPNEEEWHEQERRAKPRTKESRKVTWTAQTDDGGMALFEEMHRNHLESPTSLEDRLFELMEQPAPIQRKAYAVEPRCMVPNPIILQLKDMNGGANLTEGVVRITLVDENNQVLENALESPSGLIYRLDDRGKAHVSLRVMQTSQGHPFSLNMVILFRLEGSNTVFLEELHSDSFLVQSHSVASKRSQMLLNKATTRNATETEEVPENVKTVRVGTFTNRNFQLLEQPRTIQNLTPTETNLVPQPIVVFCKPERDEEGDISVAVSLITVEGMEIPYLHSSLSQRALSQKLDEFGMASFYLAVDKGQRLQLECRLRFIFTSRGREAVICSSDFTIITHDSTS